MTFRIFKLLLCVLALLVVNGCAKRETKQIGTTGGDTQKGTSEAEGENGKSKDSTPGEDGPSQAGKEGDDAPESSTLPGGLSESEYERGKSLVGNWDGLQDEPDPDGKWTLRAMPNPESLAGSLGSDATPRTSNGATLAEVRPIIQNSCTSCHSPTGSQATSPMVTDEQITQLMSSIKSRVRNGTMPPNGPLPQQQASIIASWTSTNAPPADNQAYRQQQQQQQQQQQPSGYSGGGGGGGGNAGGSGFGLLK